MINITQAVCATRVVTGSVLAEVAAQVLGPVLLARSADFRGLIAEPKLVMVNNTVTLQDTNRCTNNHHEVTV